MSSVGFCYNNPLSFSRLYQRLSNFQDLGSHSFFHIDSRAAVDSFLKLHGNLLKMLDRFKCYSIIFFNKFVDLSFSLTVHLKLPKYYAEDLPVTILSPFRVIQCYEICVPHETHRWATDCEPLGYMISLALFRVTGDFLWNEIQLMQDQYWYTVFSGE
jgi:hypothetical protein